mgnify:CR=1 FL=1
MIFAAIIVSIIIIFLFLKKREEQLLETVTKVHRGTKTERDLVMLLLKAGFHAKTIFHDLYLKNRYGNYSQIDVVLATKVGIIVFEVKKYSGWIFGNGNHHKWTQVLAFGKQKNSFYNPILHQEKLSATTYRCYPTHHLRLSEFRKHSRNHRKQLLRLVLQNAVAVLYSQFQ